MRLTREEAIAEHRKMWNWIADNSEYYGRVMQKSHYMVQHGFENILNDCFCCEYSKYFSHLGFGLCDSCPLIWYEGQEEVPLPPSTFHCYCFTKGSPYYELSRLETEKNVEEFAAKAREIANLKQKQVDIF